MNGNKLYKADINFATSGDHTVISAPTYGYIAIEHINFIPSSAVDVQFKDGTTSYGGAYQLDAKQPVTLENAIQNENGLIQIGSGNAFVINTSAAVQLSGFVLYRIII